ncbi:hypothetical protein B857_02654 [Solibacillus isronensis B3W22]|uniref:Uncharacterized protein n=1 Tax=Solibacillus isronensis B3W22 TaxID=1224748 RepID=K1KXB7_9BACL|nr:hypothetical protein [Solibacillus isronensis]EKB44552.1 hypothetical protein B857_02654 [Solibacillus isronensis B3W22]
MGNVEGFEVKIAAIEDSSVIIKMLKQLAQWMKEHDINQWQYLLDGGDDEEIKQAIVNQETYIVLKDKEKSQLFHYHRNKVNGINNYGGMTLLYPRFICIDLQ